MADQPAKQRREVLMARRELANAQRLLGEAMAKARVAGDLLAKALDKDPDTGPPDDDPEPELTPYEQWRRFLPPLSPSPLPPWSPSPLGPPSEGL